MASGAGKVRSAVCRAAGACAAGMADLLLPAVCGACSQPGPLQAGLCQRCQLELLALVAVPSCPLCGGSIGPNIPLYPDGCGQCADTLPRFTRTFRLGSYTGPLRLAVRELKYRRQLRLRGRLAMLLAERVRAGRDERKNPQARFDVVLPIPMHWLRRLGRGFDHARAIAAGLARELSLPLGRELVRIRNTPPQVNLSRTRRLENVRGAFAVRDRAAVAGAHVLLVDDVTTTGATANEAARVLLDADAASVALAVFAKAEPPTAYAHCKL